MPWPGAEPPLDVELTRAFAPCLPGGRLAGPLRAYRSLASTQTLARAWAAAGAPEGAVVLADHQTAGRGQHGRAWTAPAGDRAPLLGGSAPQRSRWRAGRRSRSRRAARWPRRWRPWPRSRRRSSGRTTCSSAGGSWPASWPREWPARSPLVILGIGVNVSQRESDWPPDLAGTAASLAGLGAARRARDAPGGDPRPPGRAGTACCSTRASSRCAPRGAGAASSASASRCPTARARPSISGREGSSWSGATTGG